MPPKLPPHFRPLHPYTSATPLLTLQKDPQDMPPMLPPHVLPHPPLHFCTPPLTILTLLLNPQNMPPTHPSTPLRLLPPTYPFTALTILYSHSALPPCTQHRLPSLWSRRAFPPSLHSGGALPTGLGCHPHIGIILNALIIIMLLQHPQDETTLLEACDSKPEHKHDS
ncbi:hypothetical protein O181_110300 [Austropuccinia psidii MF-1]|uniref:Uncharacterized protein n=1 Tax=Austropuccinia psidii MF-1 TaxID=1389203 RepID=A0A9Q3JW37_9BASI|nr:hypothetical protein [Austropuccinia psidii MF-1]